MRNICPSEGTTSRTGSNSENIRSTSAPKPFITLNTHIIAAVTTDTAAALIPDTMLIALCPFLEKRYRQAICLSTLSKAVRGIERNALLFEELVYTLHALYRLVQMEDNFRNDA